MNERKMRANAAELPNGPIIQVYFGYFISKDVNTLKLW